VKTFRKLLAPESKLRSRSLPFVLQWHITHRCNSRCSHCYQDTFEGPDVPVEILMDIPRRYKAFLDKRQAQNPDRAVSGHLTITGGEPFLYRNIGALIEGIKSEHPEISLAFLTNGSMIDEALARRIAGFRPEFVQLSLEGGEAIHDAIRGAGDFRRVKLALSTLRGVSIRTLVSFTAHRRNFREFDEVVHLARTGGAARVWADRWLPNHSVPQGRCEGLSPPETAEFFEIMSAVRKKARRYVFSRTEVAMHRALQFLVAGGRPYSCQAGRNLLAVMPDGDVYPCRRLPIKVGNVFEQSLETIYFGSHLLKALRDERSVPQECRSCFYAELCRGGLKCLAYAMTGDPFRKDPGCWLLEVNSCELSTC